MANQNTLIQAQQVKILEEIVNFDVELTEDPKVMNVIQQLRKEYNNLVDERLEFTRSPLSDPLRVLPLEIWTDIIREVVDESSESCVDTLLQLTAVSNSWCQTLASLRLLWTTIEITPDVDDYWQNWPSAFTYRRIAN